MKNIIKWVCVSLLSLVIMMFTIGALYNIQNVLYIEVFKGTFVAFVASGITLIIKSIYDEN